MTDHSVPWTKQGKETQSNRPQVLADQCPDPHSIRVLLHAGGVGGSLECREREMWVSPPTRSQCLVPVLLPTCAVWS